MTLYSSSDRHSYFSLQNENQNNVHQENREGILNFLSENMVILTALEKD